MGSKVYVPPDFSGLSAEAADKLYESALNQQFADIRPHDKRNYRKRVKTIKALIKWRRRLLPGYREVFKQSGTVSYAKWSEKWKFQEWYMQIIENCYVVVDVYDTGRETRAEIAEARRFNQLEKSASIEALELSLDTIRQTSKVVKQYEPMRVVPAAPAELEDAPSENGGTDDDDAADDQAEDVELAPAPQFIPPDEKVLGALFEVFKKTPQLMKTASQVGRLAREQPTGYRVAQVQGQLGLGGEVSVHHQIDVSDVIENLSMSQLEQLMLISGQIEESGNDIIDISPLPDGVESNDV